MQKGKKIIIDNQIFIFELLKVYIVFIQQTWKFYKIVQYKKIANYKCNLETQIFLANLHYPIHIISIGKMPYFNA